MASERDLENVAAMAFSADRRKRKRVALNWPVRLFQLGGPPVVTSTENLSSEGFYCILNQSFRVGERLHCEIVIPGESLGRVESPIRLRCDVTIRRVENLRSGFGMGCDIEDYALVTDGSLPAT